MIFKKKNDNVRYLIRVNKIKRYTYPFILFLKKLKILNILYPFLSYIAYFFLKIDNLPQFTSDKTADVFHKCFKANNKKENNVLFIFMLGIEKSDHFIKQLTLAKYFFDNKINPSFLVCDAFLPICDKERIFKDRTTSPNFCEICYSGFKTIQNKTELDVRYMSNYYDVTTQKIFEKEIINIKLINSIEDCKRYRYLGVPLGRLTNNSVLRHLNRSSLKINDIALYKKRLIASLKYYLTLKNYISKNNIDKMILWNGVLQFDSISRYIAENKEIDYITQENHVYTKNSWIYNKNNIAVYLKWENEWAEFKENHKLTEKERISATELYNNIICGVKFGKEFRGLESFFETNNDVRYVGLFTNVGFDTYVIGRNPIFNSMVDWLEETLSYWNKNKPNNTKLIIRAHPAEIKAIAPTQEFVSEIVKDYLNENIVFIDSNVNVDSYSILDKISYGLVYASSIGFEMVLKKIPCLVAGDTYYDQFVLKPTNRENYFVLLDKINNGFRKKNQEEDILKFIYFLFIKKVNIFKGVELKGKLKTLNFNTTDSQELVEMNIEILKKIKDDLFIQN